MFERWPDAGLRAALEGCRRKKPRALKTLIAFPAAAR
jgi:hypothetical protein